MLLSFIFQTPQKSANIEYWEVLYEKQDFSIFHLTVLL